MSSNEVKDPFESPADKKAKVKRVKIKKERLHIYLTDETIEKLDEAAEEIGQSRSVCVQLLLKYALNNFRNIPNIINGGK